MLNDPNSHIEWSQNISLIILKKASFNYDAFFFLQSNPKKKKHYSFKV